MKFELSSVVVPANAKLMIKYPSYKRASFAIHLISSGKCPKIELKEVDHINHLFKTGKIGISAARKEIKVIKERLYEIRDSQKTSVSPVNQAIVDSYFGKTYAAAKRKRMEENSLHTALNDLVRATRSLGSLDLTVADIELIQDAIDEHFESYHSHCSAVGRINSLLEYVGRGERVIRLNKPKMAVPHHTPEEFRKTLEFVSDPIRVAAFGATFYSGFREGELYAFTKGRTQASKRHGQIEIHIHEQMYKSPRKGNWYGPTKNKKERRSIALVQGKQHLREWFNLDEDTKMAYRTKSKWNSLNQIWKRACEEAQTRIIRFHDLRHSYSIQLLNRGLAPNMVADMIGDTEKCCRDYYLGHIRNDAYMEMVAKIMTEEEKDDPFF